VPILLYGANPAVSLFTPDQPDVPVAFACVWRVDWSTHGPGEALLLCYDGAPRLVTPAPDLGRWLANDFTRHFPELEGLAWSEPVVTVAPVRIESDPAEGVRAEGADIRMEITGPLDRRAYTTDSFPGNGFGLSNVYAPCRDGAVWLAGQRIPGAPLVTEAPRISSTAFLADAEVWRTP
jgi:hypothetical protein